MTRYHQAFQHQPAFKSLKGYTLKRFAREFRCKQRKNDGQVLFDGGPVLAHVGLYHLEMYRNKLLALETKNGKPRTKAAVNREVSVIRHVFSKAVEWGMMEKSPFTGTKGFFHKEPAGRVRYLTTDEAGKLLAECAPHLHPIVFTALHTGMRRGEILGLKWSQVKNGYIYLTETKSGESRQIPVSDDLSGLFKRLRGKHGLRSPHVFLGPAGKPVQEVKRSFKGACRRAGIDGFRFHDLRHTFASWLVMGGQDLRTVQELLGHKSLSMTMRYAHLSQAHKRKAVNLIGVTMNDHTQPQEPVSACIQ